MAKGSSHGTTTRVAKATKARRASASDRHVQNAKAVPARPKAVRTAARRKPSGRTDQSSTGSQRRTAKAAPARAKARTIKPPALTSSSDVKLIGTRIEYTPTVAHEPQDKGQGAILMALLFGLAVGFIAGLVLRG